MDVTGLGSSPLARGTRHCRPGEQPRRGLIPARAGNTSVAAPSTPPSQAHPRSRGEHSTHTLPLSLVTGSSPLARGTRRRAPGVLVYHGLIPAHVGNTTRRIRIRHPHEAHPRSRGEHIGVGRAHFRVSGSSPLTRGTLLQVQLLLLFTRLIPAHAGNTRPRSPSVCSCWAHPHSLGEQMSADSCS